MTEIITTEKQKDGMVFKIVAVIVTLLGLFSGIIYFTSKPSPTLSTTYSVEDLQEEIKDVAAKLLQLKQNKQQCKDGLNEYQTVAEYKGIQFFCNGTDAEIEQLKNRLASMLTMPYEQLDSHLEDGKQEQQMKMLAEGTGSAIDKLVSFLESE